VNTEPSIESPLIRSTKRSIEEFGLRASEPDLGPDRDGWRTKFSRQDVAPDSGSEQGKEDQQYEHDEDEVEEGQQEDEGSNALSSSGPPMPTQAGKLQQLREPLSPFKAITPESMEVPVEENIAHSGRRTRRSSAMTTGGYSDKGIL
jgi:hypothetical protein